MKIRVKLYGREGYWIDTLSLPGYDENCIAVIIFDNGEVRSTWIDYLKVIDPEYITNSNS